MQHIFTKILKVVGNTRLNPLMPIVSPVTHMNWPMNWSEFTCVACASRLACTRQTHFGVHASLLSHTQTTTRDGSLVYVQVESGRDRADEDISGPTDQFQLFWNCYERQRVIDKMKSTNNWWSISQKLRKQYPSLTWVYPKSDLSLF